MKQFKHFLNERRFEANNIITALNSHMYMNNKKELVEINDIEDFTLYLKEKYNSKIIGDGIYSIAIKSGNTDNPEYILKYNRKIRVIQKKDGWFNYAKSIMNGVVSNPLFPDILYAGFPLKESPDIGIGILEYLDIKAANKKLLNAFKFNVTNAYGNNIDEIRKNLSRQLTLFDSRLGAEILNDITNPRDFFMFLESVFLRNFHEEYEEPLNHHEFYNMLQKIADSIIEDGMGINPKYFWSYIDFLMEVSYNNIEIFKSKFDIHQGNIGINKNGNFVIFDPLT